MRSQALKQDLADARQRLLSIIEEHQSSEEENQNTTEEAISANEELQSLNEELETAKEELQSTNEELITVNEELRSNNAALTEARDFARLIIETAAAPLLVLDIELRIKAANPSFYRAFRLSPGEAEGQFLYSISNGCWDIPRLRDMLERILPDHKAVQDFEIEQDFPGIGHRVLMLSARQLDGLQQILLGIDDVTERKERAEATLHESEERFRNMADTAPVMIWVAGPDKACTFFNKSLAGLYRPYAGTGTRQRLDRERASGGPGPLPWRCTHLRSMRAAGFQMEYRLRRADGEYRWLLDNGVPRFEMATSLSATSVLALISPISSAPRKNILPSRSWRAWERWPVVSPTISIIFWAGYLPTRNWRWRSLPVVPTRTEELQRIRAAAIRGAEIVRQLMIYAGATKPADGAEVVGLESRLLAARTDFDFARRAPAPPAGSWCSPLRRR